MLRKIVFVVKGIDMIIDDHYEMVMQFFKPIWGSDNNKSSPLQWIGWNYLHWNDGISYI